jgi:hypothetical protein
MNLPPIAWTPATASPNIEAIDALRNALKTNSEDVSAREKHQMGPHPIAWANPDDMLDVRTSFRWIKIDEFTMPVFTSPPKKEWIGLTDEEIDALLLPECAGDSEMHDFARTIESKLKEKNA